jgi:O-antigen ligase
MANSSRIWILGAAFIVIAPLSVSGEAAGFLKWIRLLTTVAAYYFAFVNSRLPERLEGSKSLWQFILLFTVAAIWSDYPVMGMVNKGMLFFAVMTGVAMSYSVTSAKDLLGKLTLLGYTGGASSISLAYMFMTNKEESIVGDRLAIAGMNANTIGQSGAPLLLLSIYLLFKPGTKLQKGIHLASAIMLLAVILGTGSRGALLMVLLGSYFIIKPVLKKNFMAAFMVLLIPIVVLQMYGAMATDEDAVIPGINRLNAEDTRNTRSGMWKWTMKRYGESPLIGKGWLSWGGSSSVNTHNIYLHVLAECGIIGAMVFLGMLFKVFSVYRENIAAIKIGMDPLDFTYFGAGILASMLLHGMVESSTLLGTSTNALFLGFSIGLLDRSTILDREEGAPIEKEDSQWHPWAFQREQNPPNTSVNND